MDHFKGTMNNEKLHPFDDASASAPSPTTQPVSPPALGYNVTFHEGAKSKDSLASPASASQHLRNRMDSRPMLAPATSELNSSVAANTSCVSNAVPVAGAGDIGRTLSRKSSGPGGRILQQESRDSERRWTAQISVFLKDVYAKYSPSLVLENKGSIARDHLANERTYLAWLRSSLSLITVGVAVTQLFRLQINTSPASSHELIKVSELGRPLGGSFIALGIVFLWLGTSRYFHSQSVLSYGQFPASRGSVIIATVSIMAVLLACFIIVILQGRSN